MLNQKIIITSKNKLKNRSATGAKQWLIVSPESILSECWSNIAVGNVNVVRARLLKGPRVINAASVMLKRKNKYFQCKQKFSFPLAYHRTLILLPIRRLAIDSCFELSVLKKKKQQTKQTLNGVYVWGYVQRVAGGRLTMQE